MAETYVFACQRAELLGVPIPSEEEWKASRCQEPVEEDVADEEALQDLEVSGEGMQRVSGGLDELNSILGATQRKLNRFKNVCGSLGSLLKVRGGSRESSPRHEATLPSEEAKGEEPEVEANAPPERGANAGRTSGADQRRSEMERKMGSQLDKLDSLVAKAENAQYSMQHQTKQMRSFLK